MTLRSYLRVTWPLAGLGISSLVAALPAAGAPVAEVRVVEGAPTLFIHGEPAPPLLFFTSEPTPPADLRDGCLTLRQARGEAQVQATVPKGAPLVVEATVTLREAYMDDATASLRACLDVSTGATYLYGLQYLREGPQLKLWKNNGTGPWETWHTGPLDWSLGQAVCLRLEVTGGHVAGYVDGRLVAEHDDPAPLKPGDVALGAYWCEAGFSDVSVRVGEQEAVRGFGAIEGRLSSPWRDNASSVGRMQSFGDRGVRLFTYDVPVDKWWLGPG